MSVRPHFWIHKNKKGAHLEPQAVEQALARISKDLKSWCVCYLLLPDVPDCQQKYRKRNMSTKHPQLHQVPAFGVWKPLETQTYTSCFMFWANSPDTNLHCCKLRSVRIGTPQLKRREKPKCIGAQGSSRPEKMFDFVLLCLYCTLQYPIITRLHLVSTSITAKAPNRCFISNGQIQIIKSDPVANLPARAIETCSTVEPMVEKMRQSLSMGSKS